MPLVLQWETVQRLQRLPRTLRDEFPQETEEDLAQSVRAITARLVDNAKIEDFIPVLVHRYAREDLLDRTVHA